MLISRGLELRKQESETILLNEAQSLKGALTQTQGVARAFQERTQHFEEVAKSESKKASQHKEERSKDLEANFLREMTQREEALKTELDVMRKTEQAAVRSACAKFESMESKKHAHQEHEEHVKNLANRRAQEQSENERLARELELERARPLRQAQQQNTTFHSISTPRKTRSPSAVEPGRSSSGVGPSEGSSSSPTSEGSDKLSPLPSTRRQARDPKELKGIVTCGGRTMTETKTSTRVKSSIANSMRGNSSMPSRKGSSVGRGGADGGDDDDGDDDDKKKKKKDRHSSTDSSDSSEKKKKKKKKSDKRKRSKKSLSRDRKMKKKPYKSWGTPDDGKHPWERWSFSHPWSVVHCRGSPDGDAEANQRVLA
eukprot:795843-Amphidinium_carterae.1